MIGAPARRSSVGPSSLVAPGDPFSDLLRLTEARSVMAGGFTAGGTWALRVPPKREVKFGVVARGGCWLQLDGERKAVRLEQGDIGILPGPRGFVVAGSLTAEATDAVRLFAEKSGLLAQLGSGSECVFLSGVVEIHPSSAALLTGWPTVIRELERREPGVGQGREPRRDR